MKRRVVDTNVGIVANGRDTQASSACRLAAIEALASILNSGRIIVDTDGEMQMEYRRHFNPSGQPGVGDRFFGEVLRNYLGKVERVVLKKDKHDSYVDFPDDPDLMGFDQSDRKFAAAARKAKIAVLNACDSDWLDHRKALMRNGIKVEFVCGTNRSNWFAA